MWKKGRASKSGDYEGDDLKEKVRKIVSNYYREIVVLKLAIYVLTKTYTILLHNRMSAYN